MQKLDLSRGTDAVHWGEPEIIATQLRRSKEVDQKELGLVKALEVALRTQPTICFIGEEVKAKGQTLAALTALIADTVADRAAKGMEYGVILIPEGLVDVQRRSNCALDAIVAVLCRCPTFVRAAGRPSQGDSRALRALDASLQAAERGANSDAAVDALREALASSGDTVIRAE